MRKEKERSYFFFNLVRKEKRVFI